MTADTALTAALTDMVEHGQRPPCAGPDRDLWFHDRAAEREAAAWRCRSCPVIDACAAAGEAGDERWGVWGGVDRHVTQRGRRAAPLPARSSRAGAA